VNGEPLRCHKAVALIDKKRGYNLFVRNLYSAEDVIREAQLTLLGSDYHYAYFTQSMRRAGRRKTFRVSGRLDLYEEGTVEWLFDSKKHCLFSVRPKEGHVVAVDTKSKMQATKPIADFVLAPVTTIAFSNSEIFKRYKIEFSNRESKELVVDLTPRTPHSSVARAAIGVQVDSNRRRLALRSITIHTHSGETIQTELRGFRMSKRPGMFDTSGHARFAPGWKDFTVMPANKLGCKRQRW